MSDLHGEDVHIHNRALGGRGLHSFEHHLDRGAAKRYYDAAREKGVSVYTAPDGEKIKFVHNKETDRIEVDETHHDYH